MYSITLLLIQKDQSHGNLDALKKKKKGGGVTDRTLPKNKDKSKAEPKK